MNNIDGMERLENVNWETPATKYYAHRRAAPCAVSSASRLISTNLDHVGEGQLFGSLMTLFCIADLYPRFGKGIYTSSTSSKSNDYCKTLGHSQWTAMLLNSVVVGNPYSMYDNSPEQFHPPPGYDSVCCRILFQL